MLIATNRDNHEPIPILYFFSRRIPDAVLGTGGQL